MKAIDFIVWGYTLGVAAFVVLVEIKFDLPVHGRIDWVWCLWLVVCIAVVQWNYWND
jgi:heme/copper-type cytochrome/quinol oxidase subunit 4